jgi:hypothetical protein
MWPVRQPVRPPGAGVEAGCACARRAVEGQLRSVQARTLVLVADGDLLIPSREEGPHLQKLLPRSVLRVPPAAPVPALEMRRAALAGTCKLCEAALRTRAAR